MSCAVDFLLTFVISTDFQGLPCEDSNKGTLIDVFILVLCGANVVEGSTGTDC